MEKNLPLITSAMLVLTHRCNLRCRYCFVNQKPESMSLETAFDAVRFLIHNAEQSGDVPQINFFGGEPMLMWDSIIVPLTTWIRSEYKKPFQIGMTSNGTLLNDDRIQFLKDYRINLLFSIDGAKPTQDYNRPYHNGKGSFDSLADIIPKVASNFRSATFRSTVIPPTCHHVFENIMFAKESGFNHFYIVPNVFEKWTEEHKIILKGELDKYVDYYIDEYHNARTPIAFSTLEDAFLDIKRINGAITANQYRTLTQCSACGKCGLGAGRYASIHPDGNIYGCQEMTSIGGSDNIFYIGNIYTGVENDRRVSLMNLFDSTPATGSNCNTCKYNRVCTGGCVANNYLINGSLSVNPDMFCWWQQIVLESAIRIMQTLGNEQNEQFKEKWSTQR